MNFGPYINESKLDKRTLDALQKIYDVEKEGHSFTYVNSRRGSLFIHPTYAKKLEKLGFITTTDNQYTRDKVQTYDYGRKRTYKATEIIEVRIELTDKGREYIENL
jgi:hypothetical protein